MKEIRKIYLDHGGLSNYIYIKNNIPLKIKFSKIQVILLNLFLHNMVR